MTKTKQKQETQVLTIRFPVALVRKVDRYVKKFGKEFPGISFQRTDAVRLFVERGLTGPLLPEHPRNTETAPLKPDLGRKPKKVSKVPRLAKRKPAGGKKKARRKR